MFSINSPQRTLALLIDAENAQPSTLKRIMDECSIHGILIIRRAYGNWASPHMSPWQEELQVYAIQPIHQYPNTKSKNATDIALVIDVMDILHTRKVDGIIIVSSDSDYTRLAIRIREDGLLVVGIGKANTPSSFKNACTTFIVIESPPPQPVAIQPPPTQPKAIQPPPTQPKAVQPPPTQPPPKVVQPQSKEKFVELCRSALKEASTEDGWATLSALGSSLRKIKDNFNVEDYGHKNLKTAIQSMPKIFTTKTEKSGKGSVDYVRLTAK